MESPDSMHNTALAEAVRSLDVPELAPELVRLANLARQRVPQLVLGEGRVPLALTVFSEPHAAEAALEDAISGVTIVDATLDEAPVELLLDDRGLGALLPDVASGTAGTALPKVLERGLFAAALAPVAATLRNGLRLRLEPAAGGTDSRIDADGARALVEIATMPGADEATAASGWRILLILSDPAVDVLSEALERAPVVASNPAWVEAPYTLDAVVGRTRHRMATLRSVSRGDLILLPPDADTDILTMCTRVDGRAVVSGRRNEARVTVTEVHTVSNLQDDEGIEPEVAQIDAGEPIGASSDALVPDDLEVTLTFSVGAVTLPIGALSTLNEGYVFTLDPLGPKDVSIMIGSREVGRGELVQVDDRLGVRISTLPAPKTASVPTPVDPDPVDPELSDPDETLSEVDPAAEGGMPQP